MQKMHMQEYYTSLAYYRRLQAMDHRAFRRRRLQIAAEINGNGCRKTEEECNCGEHVKLIVTRNGDDISPPLCPKVIAIRRWRVDIAEGRQPDVNLMAKLLKGATIDE